MASITNMSENFNKLHFTLSGVNVSIANGIRRIIMSDIECVVFKTFPDKENLTSIKKNTSRLHNEIIKQRLACIPIHISELHEFPFDNYIVVLNKKNESDMILNVTTEDFNIMNKETQEYISDNEKKLIFPPDPITGDYIDLVKLRPKLSETLAGEEIHFESKLSIGKAKDDGSYNVSSDCFYEFTPDVDKIKVEKEAQLKSMADLEETERNYRIKDWELLDAKRLFIKDSFNFTIETIGQYSNNHLVIKACDVMISKIASFNKNINNDIIEKSSVTIPNCYDIKLINEDYTLGKVIEYILYTYYEKGKLSYCGFTKPHPHIQESIIRLAFHGDVSIEIIKELIVEVSKEATSIFENIKTLF